MMRSFSLRTRCATASSRTSPAPSVVRLALLGRGLELERDDDALEAERFVDALDELARLVAPEVRLAPERAAPAGFELLLLLRRGWVIGPPGAVGRCSLS